MSDAEEWLDTKRCLIFETKAGKVSIAPTKDIDDTSVAVRLENKEGQVRQFRLTLEAILAIHDAATYYAIDKQLVKFHGTKHDGETDDSNT